MIGERAPLIAKILGHDPESGPPADRHLENVKTGDKMPEQVKKSAGKRLVVVAVGTVSMAVRQFFGRSVAYFQYLDVEGDTLAGIWMVAIDDDVSIVDLRYYRRNNTFFAFEFDLHADSHFFGFFKLVFGNRHDHVRADFAERVARPHLHFAGETFFFIGEKFLQRRHQVFETVQVIERPVFEFCFSGFAQLIADRHYFVSGYLH